MAGDVKTGARRLMFHAGDVGKLKTDLFDPAARKAKAAAVTTAKAVAAVAAKVHLAPSAPTELEGTGDEPPADALDGQLNQQAVTPGTNHAVEAAGVVKWL